MLLAWQRLGVPHDIAQWLTAMDIGGTTVVKTPYAQYLWQMVKYYSVQTDGDYPPGHTPTTDDSVLLESFDAIRGTGQGDVTSPTCWIAVMDILLTALRRYDNDTVAKTYYRADAHAMYCSEETSYEDDMESISNNPAHLQDKADIVSAFCILAGLQLSHDKLRRVFQACQGHELDEPTPMKVHIFPWTPKAVTINATEATEYLGGLYDISNGSTNALKLIRDTVSQHCQAILHASVSAADKITVATISTLAKVRYKAALSSIRLKDLQDVDKTFSNLYRQATLNM